MSHSTKDFTASKLEKMKDSGNHYSSKAIDDSNAKADDFGMTASGVSNSSVKFKRGGAVHGEASRHRMDRPMRKDGGRVKRAPGGPAPADREDMYPNNVRPERARGGRVAKGKTNINIIIGAGKGQGTPTPVPVPVPSGGGVPLPPPRPPMPMMPPGGAPMPGAPPMAPGAGMPPPMMGRKRGGGVFHPKAGGGSGNGRLEKQRAAGDGSGLVP